MEEPAWGGCCYFCWSLGVQKEMYGCAIYSEESGSHYVVGSKTRMMDVQRLLVGGVRNLVLGATKH